MIESVRAWWNNASRTVRILIGATAFGGVVILLLLIVVVGQSNDVSDLRSEVSARGDRVVEIGTQNEVLTSDVVALEEALSASSRRVEELEDLAAGQEQALADAVDSGEALQEEMDSRSEILADTRRDLAAARSETDALAELATELVLAYSPEINAARDVLDSAAVSFACNWGSALAVDGKTSASITARAVWSAFTSSGEFETAIATPEVSAAFALLDTVSGDLADTSLDQYARRAIECWQKEDASTNAALYAHQVVFRNAALDAACTSESIEYVFNPRYGRTGEFAETAVYQNWEVSTGYTEAQDYIEAVENRFGSIKAFLAIPTVELEAEAARCEDIRDLIEPKSGGTWNVGSEIKSGTWKAYDVSDCYWARLAENGRIRANQFGDGLRLSVNISSSDGQFEISGCTFYYANP